MNPEADAIHRRAPALTFVSCLRVVSSDMVGTDRVLHFGGIRGEPGRRFAPRRVIDVMNAQQKQVSAQDSMLDDPAGGGSEETACGASVNDMTDAQVDALLPAAARRVSSVYWTSVTVARKSAQILQ